VRERRRRIENDWLSAYFVTLNTEPGHEFHRRHDAVDPSPTRDLQEVRHPSIRQHKDPSVELGAFIEEGSKEKARTFGLQVCPFTTFGFASTALRDLHGSL